MDLYAIILDKIVHSRVAALLFPVVASSEYPLDHEVVFKTMKPDPFLFVATVFNEIVLACLISAGLFEKGLSMLEGRPYSGRRAGAYILLVFGMRGLLAMFTYLGRF